MGEGLQKKEKEGKRQESTKGVHQTKRDGRASSGNPTEGGAGGVKGRLGQGGVGGGWKSTGPHNSPLAHDAGFLRSADPSSMTSPCCRVELQRRTDTFQKQVASDGGGPAPRLRIPIQCS